MPRQSIMRKKRVGDTPKISLASFCVAHLLLDMPTFKCRLYTQLDSAGKLCLLLSTLAYTCAGPVHSITVSEFMCQLFV